ncbi:MarR family transcriptional regulator [Actinomycetospora termitidis]|uniref:Helix-turn-helix domain-containing protein n=1 Tax=Actinomycetospora termitidis TaxID=3053470 RepID=A0ABT7MF89_9PSEU|nr:helix-turn-helix domain-containing protein [Actinomycetospora sp. Odt1-22]MDL5159336.1 helix-turn-helix domain-containing protein [Actinomycetospora sp. Odt1-22]
MDGRERGELERVRRAAGDELAALVLDDVVPLVNRLRLLAAGRLGLTVHELACLEYLRVAGPLTTDLLADRTGLTRGALSKLLRRLEREGHLERAPDPHHLQRFVVTLVPHQQRDDEDDRLRFLVRRAMKSAAGHARLERRSALADTVGLVRILVDALHEATLGARMSLRARRLHAQRLRQPPPVLD